jgi:signal transduction histidine kinase
MHARLLPLLIVLLAGVLLALGFPLAASQAAAEQQRVLVDRIDDTARFAALAQFVASSSDEDERLAILQDELERYHSLYGIDVGVFLRDGRAMGAAPGGWSVPQEGQGADAFAEALAGRRSHDPEQVWPWQDGHIAVASPVIRDGDVAAVVLTDSPTGQLRSRIVQDWLPIAAGEFAAMLLAVGLALRLTGWVLRPVRTLDRAAHEIALGQFKSRVAASGGPPELRRLARSFNEMADNVEDVLEQQRAFVADASHQLRNPLSALLLRIEMLGMELPAQHEEFTSVQAEGKRLARVLDSAGQSAATAWADPVALSSALDAVVDNAVKFTPEGEHVTVSVSSEGGHVTLVVADGGPGLNDEELERIGDRFWRSNRHQNISGSGLGLSITRALLSAGGASISYARNEPRGLRAVITVLRNKPTPDDEVTVEQLPTEQSWGTRRSNAVEPRES